MAMFSLLGPWRSCGPCLRQGSNIVGVIRQGRGIPDSQVMGHFGDNGVEESDLCPYQMCSVFVRSNCDSSHLKETFDREMAASHKKLCHLTCEPTVSVSSFRTNFL